MAVFFLYGLYFADLHEKLLLLHSSRMNCFMKSVNLICACTQTTSCRHDAFRKKKNGEKLLCLWIFSPWACFKFLLPLSFLYMRSILPKYWAVTLGGYILKGAPTIIHISECLSFFVPGFLKCLSLQYLSFIFLANSLKQIKSWNISSSSQFQFCLSHLGLSNYCSREERPGLKVSEFKAM